MHVDVTREHQWLTRLVGEWTYEHDAGDSNEKFTGEESVRAIGDIWIQCEGRGRMPDGKPAITLMTLGYDPAVQRFVGSFIGSMMTHQWIYSGQLNADGTVLTLDTEGPSFAGDGRIVKYRDAIELRGDDHRVLTSSQQGADATFATFMTAHYHRKR